MGNHEPRSSWSFYYSVATSTLRAIIIVAALVFGGVVLANAFPGTVNDVPSTDATTPAPTTTAPTQSPTSPAAPVQLEGALLQVLNGTDTSGLAGDVARCLRDQGGADVPEANIGNAPEDYEQTTLVHRADALGIAELLRERFFPGAALNEGVPVPENPDVQVSVIVGTDYEPVDACA